MSGEEFILYKMFLKKCWPKEARTTLSDEEIARLCGVRLERVPECVEQDIKAGMFVKKQGTSTYYLTLLGSHILYKKSRTFKCPFWFL